MASPARSLPSLDDLVLIGDIHGDAARYCGLIAGLEAAHPGCYSIQLGDLQLPPEALADINPARHWFLRGNHDDPERCRKDPHYLGDFGLIEVGDRAIFFVGGALPSPNEGGETWAPELSEPELEEAQACYAGAARRIDLVLSHEWSPGGWRPPEQWGATRQFFTTLKKLYFPSLWICAHRRKEASREFRALDGSCFYYQVGARSAVPFATIRAKSPRPPMP